MGTCRAVGNYRRKILGAYQPADFFDPANEKGEEARREMAAVAFTEMVGVLKTDVIDIAIFDATNTTQERRKWLKDALHAEEQRSSIKFQLVFVEPVCDDEEIIKSNVRETKLKSPDYQGKPARSPRGVNCGGSLRHRKHVLVNCRYARD
jgi:hypothetical protein